MSGTRIQKFVNFFNCVFFGLRHLIIFAICVLNCVVIKIVVYKIKQLDTSLFLFLCSVFVFFDIFSEHFDGSVFVCIVSWAVDNVKPRVNTRLHDRLEKRPFIGVLQWQIRPHKTILKCEIVLDIIVVQSVIDVEAVFVVLHFQNVLQNNVCFCVF